MRSRVSIVAQEIMKGIQNQPLNIMVSNLSNKHIHLLERLYVKLVVYVPQMIVTFTTKDEIDSVNEIRHYKEKEDEQKKLGGHR